MVRRCGTREETRSHGTSGVSDWQDAIVKLVEAVGVAVERPAARPSRGVEGRWSIPNFDPAAKNQAISVWIQKIEELQGIYGWDDTTTASLALEHLKGVAKGWYEGLDTVAFSWSEWKAKLVGAFTSHTRMADRMTAMLARKKLKNETMMEFYFSNANLVAACNVQGKDAADCIAQDITDHALALTIARNGFETPEALRVFLSTIEEPVEPQDHKPDPKITFQGRPKQHHQQRSADKPSPVVARDTSSSQGPRNTTTEAAMKPNPVKCYRCNRFGHIARNCTPAVEGNIKKVLNIGAGPPATDVRFQEAVMEGTSLQAYIDSGSQCVTLREEDAGRMQLELRPTDAILRGYGGGAVNPCGVARANLKVDLAEGEVDVHIVPDHMQAVPLIVGQPFLDLPGVTTVLRDGQMRLFDRTMAELPEVEGLPSQKLALWATETTIIPPQQAADVKVSLRDDYVGDLYVELSVRGEAG